MLTPQQAAITRLAAAFPRDRVEKATIELYVAKLSRFPVDVLNEVVEGLIVNAPRFPSLADIRTAILRVQERQRDAVSALPTGPPQPMPDCIKQQIRDTNLAAEVLMLKEEKPGRRGPLPGCSGIGKPAVRSNGKWVCPDCGVDGA